MIFDNSAISYLSLSVFLLDETSKNSYLLRLMYLSKHCDVVILHTESLKAIRIVAFNRFQFGPQIYTRAAIFTFDFLALDDIADTS